MSKTSISEAIEDYAKAIYAISRARDGLVLNGEVAQRLGVAPATATSMLKRLAGLGFVDYVPYKGVSLTPAGERVALEVIRHHRLIEAYLSEALGMPERPRPRGGGGARALHLRGPRAADRRQARRTEPRPPRHADPRPRPAARRAGGRPAVKPPPPPREGATVEDVLPGEARVAEAARRSLDGHNRGIGRIWPFLGPAFIAAVAYIDPGNFATNIAGGAKFGYLLLWVVLSANLIAMLVQTQSAKLGIATGKNLAELCRERFSRRTSIGLWLQAELVAMATDIAEVVGAALGLNLLFGIPLFPAGLIAGAGAFAHPRPAADGLPAARGRDHGAGRRRRRLLRLRALRRQAAGERNRPPPLRPRLRGHREHPARHRDHRRDGDAARRLPALGADPAADRRPRRGREEEDPPLREGRRGDRPLAGRPGQPLDDDRRRGALPRAAA